MMSDSRAYLNGFGASAALLAAVGVAFALLAGTFAYQGGQDSLGPGEPGGVAELPSAAGPGAAAAAAFASVPGSVASLSEAARLVGGPGQGGSGEGGNDGGSPGGGGGSGSPPDPVTQILGGTNQTLNTLTGVAYPLIDGLNPLNGGGLSLNLGNQSMQLLPP